MAIEPKVVHPEGCIGSKTRGRVTRMDFDLYGRRRLAVDHDVVMPMNSATDSDTVCTKQEGWTLEDVGKIIPVRVTPNGSYRNEPVVHVHCQCARRNSLAPRAKRWFPRGTRMLARVGTGPNDGAFRRFGRVRPNGAFMFLRS